MAAEQDNGRDNEEHSPQSAEAGETSQQSDEAVAENQLDNEQTENQAEQTDESSDAADDPVQQLEERVARLEEDKLRLAAETQNALRRSEQEVEKARKFALESFSKDLLPVVDNLERALQAGAGSETAQAVLEGVELTLKTFQETLERYQLQSIDPQGEPFDPQEHQAMSIQENADVEPNTVLTVFQKGYRLNGRLVRPAMVVVSKSPG